MKMIVTIMSMILWSSLSSGEVPQEDSHINLSCECWKEAHPHYGLVNGGSVSFSGDGGRVEVSGNTQEEAVVKALEACQAVFPNAEEEPYIRYCVNGEESVCT